MRRGIASMAARMVPTLLLIATLLACGGCAASPIPVLAALDVLNAAETAKTGYDLAAGLNARKPIESPPSRDDQAEARLRAQLEAEGGLLAQATPHVLEGHAYIVGVYASQAEREEAARLALGVPGIRRVTLCLFPEGRSRAGNSDGELRDMIIRLSGVRTREVRVRVVQGNAVLLGFVRSQAERDKLVASARSAGATSVQNHLRLAEAPAPASAPAK